MRQKALWKIWEKGVELWFMKSLQEQFLNLKTAPARLKVEETSWYLGFAPHEITILMSEGLLKPLGHPPISGVKYFSSVALEELRRDEKWLARASDCIVQYWKSRNEKRPVPREKFHDAPCVLKDDDSAA